MEYYIKVKKGKAIPVTDRFWGQMVRILGYRSRSSGSIPGTTRFSEK
jgi:hypothetical protein